MKDEEQDAGMRRVERRGGRWDGEGVLDTYIHPIDGILEVIVQAS